MSLIQEIQRGIYELQLSGYIRDARHDVLVERVNALEKKLEQLGSSSQNIATLDLQEVSRYEDDEIVDGDDEQPSILRASKEGWD